jgi:hypothetical protein
LDIDPVELSFDGEIWHWRGPSPFYFITVPDEPSAILRAVSSDVSYGWGMISVRVWTGGTMWETSLFPKDGRYVLPIKDAVRAAERLAEGDTASIRLELRQ